MVVSKLSVLFNLFTSISRKLRLIYDIKKDSFVSEKYNKLNDISK